MDEDVFTIKPTCKMVEKLNPNNTTQDAEFFFLNYEKTTSEQIRDGFFLT